MLSIPEDKINEVRDRASIVSIISHYVNLKRRGLIIRDFAHSTQKKHLLLLSVKQRKFTTVLGVEREAMYLRFSWSMPSFLFQKRFKN